MMALRACSVLRRNNSTSNNIVINLCNDIQRLSVTSVRSLHGPPKVNEFADEPLYPPIPQFKDKKDVGITKTKNFIAKLGTVEEKQYFINKPKYYGWYSYMLDQSWIPCDARPFLQFATQTHVVETLPERLSGSDAEVDTILSELGPSLEQIIVNHHAHCQRGYEVENEGVAYRDGFAKLWKGREHILEQKRSHSLVKSIHQEIMRHLVTRRVHLRTASEDVNCRNEAFWFRGGIDPDTKMIKKRTGTQKMQQKVRDRGWHYAGSEDGLRPVISDEQILEPYDRALQYVGSNMIQLRSHLPLSPRVSRDTDPLVTGSHVEPVTCDPRMWGYKTSCRHGTSVPGVWADVNNQHGLLFYTDRFNAWTHQAFASQETIDNERIQRDMMVSKALLSSWGWLSAQASHLGFSPLTELTYPLVTQGAVTDGQLWTFASYQLNRLDLSHGDTDQQCNNVMWVGGDSRLYHQVDSDTGKVEGFNPSVLAPLVKMYLNEPKARDYSLTPYLSKDKTVSNFPEPYQRNLMHVNHRYMYSNRPRHIQKPEIYWWEKVNLIDNKGMYNIKLGARRRRWFQMYKVHHWGREHWHPEFEEYEQKTLPYVPKAFRKEDFMKKKGLGRRYSKYNPKLTVPLEDEAAVYKLPNTKYKKPEPGEI